MAESYNVHFAIDFFVFVDLCHSKGYKRKEELRENARIQSKFLVDSARIKFAMAKTDADYLDIYQWLNEEIRKLQLNQATEYFTVHNNRNSYET